MSASLCEDLQWFLFKKNIFDNNIVIQLLTIEILEIFKHSTRLDMSKNLLILAYVFIVGYLFSVTTKALKNF